MKASSFARRNDYASYLLRVWQVESDGKRIWRASLENVHTGERRGFASLELAFTFLREQMHKQTDCAVSDET
ncbi:MAG: hypothetical protein HZB51_12725 [Chloroflexi bacterium]|nr:hypothetical protein [Chloroflexota bacterium]